ncbi:MAG: SDR family oxidoreductase, partial [Rhodospirillaceae bacterium]|nr:SDR family oxidoreductase [Rhodospirillaceae bacterium]
MSNSAGLMAGKKGLIMGVANNRSIAWHIAKAASDQGAELAFTYQGDALLKRLAPLAESIGSDIIIPCDVTDDGSVDKVFDEIEEKWGKLDFVL